MESFSEQAPSFVIPIPTEITVDTPPELLVSGIIILIVVMIAYGFSSWVSYYKLNVLPGIGIFVTGMSATAFLAVIAIQVTFGSWVFA